MLRNLGTVLFGVLDKDLFNNPNKPHKNIFQNKNYSSCCDERCGLVEKPRNGNSDCILADQCPVEFFAVVRKTRRFLEGAAFGEDPSTNHPHHSHAIPTCSAQAIRVTNFRESHPTAC